MTDFRKLRLALALMLVGAVILWGCGDDSGTGSDDNDGTDAGGGTVLIEQGYDLRSLNLENSTVTTLTSDGSSNEDYYAQFTPDGSKIVWQVWSSGEGYNVWAMSPDGSGKIQLASNAYIASSSAVRPNGHVVCALASDTIAIIDLAGGRVVNVVTGNSGVNRPRFSPDGSKIAYLDNTGVEEYDVHIVNSDGSGDIVIGNLRVGDIREAAAA